MSEAYLSSPRIGEEGRELFEQKYTDGDVIVTSQMRVDASLRRIRLRASDADLDQFESIAESHLGDALNAVTYESAESIMDYFRLKIKHVLIRQIVFADSAFSQRDKFELRRELVDGIYGSISLVLEEALQAFDNAAPDEIAHLTGIINELTALALLNRRQAPERLAIPSDVTSDLYNATDLEYFTFTKGKSKPSVYHIQVKTSNKKSSDIRMPLGGILITAHTMCNDSNDQSTFPTSRAIVAETSALDTSEQATHLEEAARKLDVHMLNGTAKAEKTYKILENIPQELLQGAFKAVQNLIKQALQENPDATQIILEWPETE